MCCVLAEHITLVALSGVVTILAVAPARGVDAEDAFEGGDASCVGPSEIFALATVQSGEAVTEGSFAFVGISTIFLSGDMLCLIRTKSSFNLRRIKLAILRTASDLCTRRFKI